MPQTCRVCAHPKTKDIEDSIIQGVPHTTIAKQYDIHFQSVRYHSENHLPDKLVKAARDKGQKHADNILSGIKDLLERTNAIMEQAEDDGHNRLALDAIKEARSTYELLSKIAVKMEEYQRKNHQREDDYLDKEIEEGLKVLSDEELNALFCLIGKVHEAKPNYELDPVSRDVVHMYKIIEEETAGDSNSIDDHASEDKNSLKSGEYGLDDLDLEFEELDLDDLGFEDDEIPSEYSDPKWLRKERGRNSY